MIDRKIEPIFRDLTSQYPVVTLTGPRQSGKTTLCRKVFPDMAYVNLERPDVREYASTDPLGFLSAYENGVIIDEIQRVPDLVSYIQSIVDERRSPGLDVFPVEVKAGATIAEDFFKGLKHFSRVAGEFSHGCGLIYGGAEFQQRGKTRIYPVSAMEKMFDALNREDFVY